MQSSVYAVKSTIEQSSQLCLRFIEMRAIC